MPHSITDGDACFAYFNKRWGIPEGRKAPCTAEKRRSASLSHGSVGSMFLTTLAAQRADCLAGHIGLEVRRETGKE